jgi:hypothetical protein
MTGKATFLSPRPDTGRPECPPSRSRRVMKSPLQFVRSHPPHPGPLPEERGTASSPPLIIWSPLARLRRACKIRPASGSAEHRSARRDPGRNSATRFHVLVPSMIAPVQQCPGLLYAPPRCAPHPLGLSSCSSAADHFSLSPRERAGVRGMGGQKLRVVWITQSPQKARQRLGVRQSSGALLRVL